MTSVRFFQYLDTKQSNNTKYCCNSSYVQISNQFYNALRIVPYSNEFRIIFPWCQDLDNYNTEDFDLQDINDLKKEDLDSLTLCLKNDIKYQIKENVLKEPFYIKYIKLTSLFMILIVVISFAAFKGNWQGYPVIASIFLFYIIVVHFLVKRHVKKEVSKKLQLRQNEVQYIVDKWNKELFQKNGFSLTIGTKTAWLA